MSNSATATTGTWTPIDYAPSGEKLRKWLHESRTDQNKSVLFVVGAGISMTGVAPAPSGWRVGESLENYLSLKQIDIPPGVKGDIAKLYEYYCYALDKGTTPSFDPQRHTEFAAKITSNASGFFMSGEPNDEHRSLEREVFAPGANVRLYTLNVDEFFIQAIQTRISVSPPDSNTKVVNAYDLIAQPQSHDYRDWRILHAHGLRTTRSVWSERLLSNVLTIVNDAWKEERDILHAAIKCISQGPIYARVIFVGVNAPVTYLLDSLENKILKDNFEWMWINPGSPPQDWLTGNAQSIFREDNGIWAKATFSEVMNEAIYLEYYEWMRHSCGVEVDISSWGKGVARQTKIQNVIKAFHRARRLYFESAEALGLSGKSGNVQLINEFHSCTHAYTPPLLENYQYSDKELATTLNFLQQNSIRITADPGDDYPKLTVAKGNNISVQIAKLKDFNYVNEISEELFKNIREWHAELVTRVHQHGHLILLDTVDIFAQMISSLIEDKLTQAFSIFGHKPSVRVLTFGDVSGIVAFINQLVGRATQP